MRERREKSGLLDRPAEERSGQHNGLCTAVGQQEVLALHSHDSGEGRGGPRRRQAAADGTEVALHGSRGVWRHWEEALSVDHDHRGAERLKSSRSEENGCRAEPVTGDLPAIAGPGRSSAG